MAVEAHVGVTLDAETILARARALEPAIRDARERIEDERRLPDDLLAQLTDAGVFRIAMPRSWGGPEMDPLTQIELVETLSRADASVGWVVMITSDSGFYSAFLEPEVARKLHPRLDMRTAGALYPAGRAVVEGDGYRVTGHWSFGSGVLHADHVVGGCLVVEGEQPRVSDGTLPEWRVVYLPREEVEVLDTWHTTGLRGTGSHDYRVKDVFVPAEYTFDVFAGALREEPLYAYHGMFFSNLPGVPLGLARAAIEEVKRLAHEKRVPPRFHELREEYRVQEAVGEAEGQLQAARALVWDVMGDVWDTLRAGNPLSQGQRTRVGMMIAHSVRTGRDVAQIMYDVAGGSAVYRRSPLDRYLRDAVTAAAHLVGQRRAYALVGQVMLDLDPPLTYF